VADYTKDLATFDTDRNNIQEEKALNTRLAIHKIVYCSKLKKLRDSYPDKIIDTIEMTMYGMMDGKGVVDLIHQKLNV
jgi:hypothetical protein